MVCVKFKDDTILYGCYNGTSDVLVSGLLDDPDYWHNAEFLKCTCGNHEEVEIYNSYGSNEYWTGIACKTCKCITSDLSFCYDYDEYREPTNLKKGIPEWVKNIESKW